MSDVPEMFGNRAKCVTDGCKFLGRLAASGVCVERAIEAGRQAAALPYERCVDGQLTSKPDRAGNTVQFCGMGHAVQTGALAVAAYVEGSAVSWPGAPDEAAAPAATIVLTQPVLEQQP